MCGIVGYITSDLGKHPAVRDHFMRYALIYDTIRGEQSTGLITVGHNFKVSAFRSLLPGHQFVEGKVWNEHGGLGWCNIGHNRAATRGSVKLENAHPFRYGDVTMVHNGTLNHWGSSLPTFKKEFDVDSMQIAYALSQYKPEDAKTVLELIDGSFAIVWTDERDQSVNMARNTERPMHFSWNKERDFLMFMSDGFMLHTINRSLRWASTMGGSVYQIDAMKHLKWKQGSIVPEVTTFRPFVRPPVRSIGVQPSERVTALQRATDKWGTRLKESSKGSKSYSGLEPKVRIAGKTRQIPDGMMQSLKQFFHLTGNEVLQFTPEAGFILDEVYSYVTGSVYLPKWEVEWDCVLHRVPTILYNNLRNQDWSVRPVGMTARLCDGIPDIPSVLCTLMAPSWKEPEVSDDDVETLKDQLEDDEDKQDSIYVGPSGCFMSREELIDDLREGCINCGNTITIAEADRCEYVNEGRDVVCPDCKWDHSELH